MVPSNLPNDKLDIFEEHFENALGTFALVKELQKTEEEYNLFSQDYRDLHFSVRKKQKKIRKIEKKIKELEAEIRNLYQGEIAAKNKINLKIEDSKLEIDELIKEIPKEWKEKNKEFKIIYKSKNIQTKKYRKNVDQAYENLNQIVIFIKDHERLKKLLTDVNKLKIKINEKDYKNSISIIEDLLNKIGKISGTDEFANRLDDLKSLLNSSKFY